MLQFRDVMTAKDPEIIRNIAGSTGFFDKKDTEINFVIAKNALQGYNKEKYRYIFAEYNGKTVAYACFGKILDADFAYELYWLSTLNEYRGLGIGKKIMNELLLHIKKLGGRKLFVKTEGTTKYLPTRQFYEKCGFRNEAILKEYYQTYDDCHIYSYHL
ncbi:MAG: GNAT family N-acetyltransferase [Alphaproteobacteria bacterium]